MAQTSSKSKPPPSTVANIESRRGGGGSAPGFHRGKYAPDSFIVPGQDQNGNSIRAWCRVVPLLDRAMDILFSSRKFPFKSKGDLIRWCIKTGVDRLHEMEPITGSVTMQVEAIMAALRDEMHNFEFLTVFQTMTSSVGMCVQAQAIGEARRQVTIVQTHIDKMEPGYWRDRYNRELKDKFGYLLKGTMVDGAGLGEHSDHGPDKSTGTDEDEWDG